MKILVNVDACYSISIVEQTVKNMRYDEVFCMILIL